jgi:hypothetical protein
VARWALRWVARAFRVVAPRLAVVLRRVAAALRLAVVPPLLRAVVLRDDDELLPDAVQRRDVLPVPLLRRDVLVEPVLREVERLLAALRLVDRLFDVVLRLRVVVVFFSAMVPLISNLLSSNTKDTTNTGS